MAAANGVGGAALGGVNWAPQSVGLIDFDQLKTLGQGQYGTVYLVRHRVTAKLLAMKQLSKGQTVADDAVENTKTERAVLRQIKHPFIVQLQVADFCVDAERAVVAALASIQACSAAHHCCCRRWCARCGCSRSTRSRRRTRSTW